MDEILCPIYQQAQEIPDQIAIATPERSLTYSELNAALANLVSTLKGLSIQPKAHVAFVATTSLPSILLLFSLFRLKATACPLSFRTPAEQIPTLMERCSASHLLRADDLPLLTTPLPSDPPTYAPDQLATILMTSGSSGTPKAACHTIHNHVANAQGALTPLQCTSATRWLLSLPLFHVGGLGILFRCFTAGGTVVISNQPLSAALEHNQITHASLVPTQLFRLLQEPQEQIAALAQSMRCLLIGGAPLSASLAQKARPLPLFTTYGMTEMSSMTTLAQPQEIRNNLHMEAVAKLLCPEKSMILRPFASGSIAAAVHATRPTPCGLAEEDGRKGPQKGDFSGRMSFATASAGKAPSLPAIAHRRTSGDPRAWRDSLSRLLGSSSTEDHLHDPRWMVCNKRFRTNR